MIWEEHGWLTKTGEAKLELSKTKLELGDGREAKTLAERTLEDFREQPHVAGQSAARDLLARALQAEG